jgi:hypothetical protein
MKKHYQETLPSPSRIQAFLLAVDDALLDTDAATMAFLLAVDWWRQINKYTSINHRLHGNWEQCQVILPSVLDGLSSHRDRCRWRPAPGRTGHARSASGSESCGHACGLTSSPLTDPPPMQPPSTQHPSPLPCPLHLTAAARGVEVGGEGERLDIFSTDGPAADATAVNAASVTAAVSTSPRCSRPWSGSRWGTGTGGEGWMARRP